MKNRNVNVESMNLKNSFEKWLSQGRKGQTVQNYKGHLEKLITFLNVVENDFYRMNWFKLKCLFFKLESSKPFLSLRKGSRDSYSTAMRGYLKFVKTLEFSEKKQPVIIQMNSPLEFRKAA